MIFAAGFGSRMDRYTNNTPKPLLKVGKQCLIDIIIQRLEEYGITKIVINCHYRADQIIAHVRNNPKVIISYEENILETGGGLLNALPLFGDEPIITVNADTIWYKNDLLLQLTECWQKHSNPDLVMALYDSGKMLHHTGEYEILDNGQIAYNKDAKLVYSGIQIIYPAIVKQIRKTYFSLTELYKLLIHPTKGEAYGLEYHGDIFHIGSVAELEQITKQ